MNKQFQRIKISIIFLILLCSSIFFICPLGKSAPMDQLYECEPVVILEYDDAILDDPVIPYDEPTIIPLTVKGKINGKLEDIVLGKIGEGSKIIAIIDLSVAEVSEGCHAAINPQIVQFPVSNEFMSANATLSLTIDQYLPAFSLKNIKINMVSRGLGILVKRGNFTQDIPFVVGYLPQLSFSYPDNNVRSIGPDETASFNIEIENWGNANTKVNTEIIDLPEGWNAKIDLTTTLKTAIFGGASKTISLNVKPPIDFGYHEDRAIIKVKMTPVYYNDSDYSGDPHYLYFIVQSKGFSAPGFETVTILLVFIFVLFPILKRKNKNKGGDKK